MSESFLLGGTHTNGLLESIGQALFPDFKNAYHHQVFPNGEQLPRITASVRNKHVYFVQSICPPYVDAAWVETLLVISALKGASACSVTLIIPHFGYSRQDRKTAPRVPISFQVLAQTLLAVGVDRIMTLDLHCAQTQGFFPGIPFDNLAVTSLAVNYFQSQLEEYKQVAIISPDAGGVTRARNFEAQLSKVLPDHQIHLCMINKQRNAQGKIENMSLVGQVKDCLCIIFDDMIDTAGTLCKSATVLKKEGALNVWAFATHGLFSGPALNNIQKSCLSKVIVCNTVPIEKICDKIEILDVAPFLTECINKVIKSESLSEIC